MSASVIVRPTRNSKATHPVGRNFTEERIAAFRTAPAAAGKVLPCVEHTQKVGDVPHCRAPMMTGIGVDADG